MTQALSDSPARVLFVHSSDDLYGSDIVLLELVRRLDRARFTPLVVLPSDLPTGRAGPRLSSELADLGVQVNVMDVAVLRRRYLAPRALPGFARRLWRGSRALARLIDQEAIDLIHANTTAVLGGAWAARLARRPIVWHVHEIITQPRWLRWLIARLVTTWATHVVANSGPAASHLLALGAAPGAQARLSVIPDAVDTTRFHPNNDSRPLRSTWGIAPDQVLIGVVGRIHTGKGHGVLVEAVSMLHDRCPQARFVVVGDVVPGQPQPKHDLEAAIARHGLVNRVTLAGFCADAPSVMAALDVLVLPSTSPEPFGLVLVEAMASAKPVVATAHGGPLDIILDGQTGLLVPPGDAQALAAALERLIADPGLRAAMGAAGRKRAEAQFAFEPHVAAFQSLYDRALHSDHRRQTQ